MISVGGSSMRERTCRITQPGGEADGQAADAAGDELGPASQSENEPDTTAAIAKR